MGKPVRSLPSSRPRRKRTVAAVMPKRAASRRRGGPTTRARVGNKSSSAAPGSGYGGAVDGVLPPEMLHEVLLRLPAKPICRLRAVCHSWRSFTSDPLFAAAHAARHPHTALLLAVGVETSPTPRINLVDLSGNVVKHIPCGCTYLAVAPEAETVFGSRLAAHLTQASTSYSASWSPGTTPTCRRSSPPATRNLSGGRRTTHRTTSIGASPMESCTEARLTSSCPTSTALPPPPSYGQAACLPSTLKRSNGA